MQVKQRKSPEDAGGNSDWRGTHTERGWTGRGKESKSSYTVGYIRVILLVSYVIAILCACVFFLE